MLLCCVVLWFFGFSFCSLSFLFLYVVNHFVTVPAVVRKQSLQSVTLLFHRLIFGAAPSAPGLDMVASQTLCDNALIRPPALVRVAARCWSKENISR